MQQQRYLRGIKAIDNKNNITLVELTTDLGKEYIKIPYKVKQITDNKNKIEYSMSIKRFCSARNINYRGYFGLVHSDCC